jgi:hypothetical protein
MKPTRLMSEPVGASSGVTFTNGLPALAMMNGSPFAASSTRRDKCVFASWMLIVRTWQLHLN